MHSSSVFQTLYDALLIYEIYWGLHFSHTHAAMNTSSFVLCRRTLFMAVRTFHMAFPNGNMFLDGAAKNVSTKKDLPLFLEVLQTKTYIQQLGMT